MHRWCCYALLVLSLAGSGCQPNPLKAPAQSSSQLPIDKTVVTSANVSTEFASIEDVSAPNPTGDLSLNDAVALAIEHGPRLEAFSLDVRVAEARAVQAGLWANPELEAEVENIAGRDRLSGTDAAESTISLAQLIPIGGDIHRRKELAGVQVEKANWDYEAARIEVVAEVTQRFVEALASDRRLILAKQALELATETERVIEQRVKAGDASPVEQSRILVPVIVAEVELKQAELARDAAYQRLALTWDGQEVTYDRVVGDLDSVVQIPEARTLVRYISNAPAVAEWTAEISQRIAERRLAEAEAKPDLTGRIGLKHFSEDDESALVVGLSLPLPVSDRRQGDIRAARLGEASARLRRREAELRIEAMLSTAYSQLVSSYTESTMLHDRALPAANDAYESTKAAFDHGSLPFIDVLDAQRTLFDLQRRYVEGLVRYHTAVIEIETLIGHRLSDLNESEDNTNSVQEITQ